MKQNKTGSSAHFAFSEAELILAQKRTSLSLLNTGIAVFALPLSVLGLLVATSKYYDFMQVLPWIVPLLALCAALVVLGTYLVVRAVRQIRHYDRLIVELKEKYGAIAKAFD